MSVIERKSSIVGSTVAFGAGVGFVLELFAASEIPFGTGMIIGALVGFFFGSFFKTMVMSRRNR